MDSSARSTSGTYWIQCVYLGSIVGNSSVRGVGPPSGSETGETVVATAQVNKWSWPCYFLYAQLSKPVLKLEKIKIWNSEFNLVYFNFIYVDWFSHFRLFSIFFTFFGVVRVHSGSPFHLVVVLFYIALVTNELRVKSIVFRLRTNLLGKFGVKSCTMVEAALREVLETTD